MILRRNAYSMLPYKMLKRCSSRNIADTSYSLPNAVISVLVKRKQTSVVQNSRAL